MDSFGETLGGLTDTVLAGGEKLYGAWVDSKTEEVKTAAPEENRPAVRPAEQPTGQPVRPDVRGALDQMKPLMYGGGALMLLMFAAILFRGK
ncbi:hypothetical protein P4S70_25680 [Enterovibrio sp. Hal110]